MTAIDDVPLFDYAVAPVSLADRFTMPPFTVLDRRSGEWQRRKRQWLALGFVSDAGRAERLTFAAGGDDPVSTMMRDEGHTTSIFDPVLCELAYRWFSAPGDRVVDLFAGGSVRGITAAHLHRHYVGAELRPEQVEANQAQSTLAPADWLPHWIENDATTTDHALEWGAYDLAFTCPPYADLEVYSDDPRDLSTMPYSHFLTEWQRCLLGMWRLLHPDRFCVVVVGDVRSDKGDRPFRGLVADTITAARDIGFGLVNEAIVVDPVGSLRLRTGRQFVTSRKMGRSHQHMLVFSKGSARAATDRLPDVPGVDEDVPTP